MIMLYLMRRHCYFVVIDGLKRSFLSSHLSEAANKYFKVPSLRHSINGMHPEFLTVLPHPRVTNINIVDDNNLYVQNTYKECLNPETLKSV